MMSFDAVVSGEAELNEEVCLWAWVSPGVHSFLFMNFCDSMTFHILFPAWWCSSWERTQLHLPDLSLWMVFFNMLLAWATSCDLKVVLCESRFLRQHFLLACLHILCQVYQDLQQLSLVMGWHFLLQQLCFRSISLFI
jgi:hypothetical protein